MEISSLCAEEVIFDEEGGVVQVNMGRSVNVEACIKGVRAGLEERGFRVTGEGGYYIKNEKEIVEIYIEPKDA